MPIRNLEEWNVQLFRLTLFPEVGHDFRADEAFEIVAEVPPDEMQSQRESGQEMYRAALGPGDLQLVKQLDRIHVALTANQERQSDDPNIPTLGSYPDQVNGFLQIAERWLGSDSPPEAIRLAFGAILLAQVDNQHEGYDVLSQYIPSLDIDPHSISDLDYRINRWRFLQGGIRELKVNRVTKWSVAMSLFAGLRLGPEGVKSTASSHAYAVRLELDISTDQFNEDPFPRQSLYPILDELVGLGTEIASEGDIP